MLRSMTGYGRGHAVVDCYDITVEVKSVNHRYFEFSSRIPKAYLFLEDRLKGIVQGSCSRGKVEAAVSIQTIGGSENEISLSMIVPLHISISYLFALASFVIPVPHFRQLRPQPFSRILSPDWLFSHVSWIFSPLR